MNETERRVSHGPTVYFLEAKETKGLDYDYVFILNLSKTTYTQSDEIEVLIKRQSHKRQDISEDLEELKDKEKRILYVSLTRAKQEDFLYYTFKTSPEDDILPFVEDFEENDFEFRTNKK
jgi:DNA helicase II / ATP-dependent DNA helicase PcrA